MKNKTIKTISIFVLVCFCCFRALNQPPNSATWTIAGSTYYADSCYAPVCDSVWPCVVTAQTPFDSSNMSNFSQLNIIFGSPPSSTQTYSLVSDSIFINDGLDSTQAFIQMSKEISPSIIYQSINGTLSISVNSSGELSVTSGSSVNVERLTPPNDIVQLVFSIGVMPSQ